MVQKFQFLVDFFSSISSEDRTSAYRYSRSFTFELQKLERKRKRVERDKSEVTDTVEMCSKESRIPSSLARHARYIRIGNVANWICMIRGIPRVIPDHWPISSSTSSTFSDFIHRSYVIIRKIIPSVSSGSCRDFHKRNETLNDKWSISASNLYEMNSFFYVNSKKWVKNFVSF